MQSRWRWLCAPLPFLACCKDDRLQCNAVLLVMYTCGMPDGKGVIAQAEPCVVPAAATLLWRE